MAKPLVSLVGVVVFAAGCAGGSDAGGGDLQALDQVVEWVREVELEESGDLINVAPRASSHSSGGFLVSDFKEAKVRLYRPDGTLAWQVGSYGDGPGEFVNPAGVHELPSGEIVAVDMNGRLTTYPATGDRPLQTSSTLVYPLFDVLPAAGGRYLLVGRREAGGDTRLLHEWDPATAAVTRSFFAPPMDSRKFGGASRFAARTSAAIRGDTIAAVVALVDTLYLFHRDGRPLDKVAIPFRGYRPINSDPPRGGPVERRRWMESFSQIATLAWMGDGTLVVGYVDLVDTEPRWRLLGMNTRGERLFEVDNVPKLLGVDSRRNELYFTQPGSLTPNRWAIAKLR